MKRFLDITATTRLITALLLVAALFGSACGVRKAPRPPAKKLRQSADITAVQRGTSILTTIRIPQFAADAGASSPITRVDVYRLITSENERPDESEFAARSNLVVALDITDELRKKGGNMSFEDSIDFVGRRVLATYSVRLVREDGQRLPFSSLFTIKPVSAVAKAPAVSDPKVTQDRILVEWTAPTANLDGTSLKSVLGYNVYREAKGEKRVLLNKTPVAGNEYQDSNFSFGTLYTYTVRSVSVGSDGAPVESDDSKAVTVKPVDTFAPAPPTAITLAASSNTISLFFAANLERDVKGYRLFRSDSADLPLSQWVPITPELLTKTTFVDEKVEAGKTYYYFIIAVDSAGNESQPSEVVSETVPAI